jgi:hypothetical protein
VRSSAGGLEALRALRAARRRRYAENIDILDVLYRLYLGVLFGGWGLALISGALADVRVDHHTVLEIHRHGPAALGLLVALSAAAGLRSGSRGGPLVLEAADVQHVLLAPIDRGTALRGLAVRRLRTAAFVGIVAGLIAGNFAFRRLPGSPAGWLLCGAVFGAVLAVWGLGAAMIASGRRLHRGLALVLALAIVGWSVADLLTARTTSPATMLGQLALWPLHHPGDSFALPGVGLVVCALCAVLGLAGLAGTSLQAAQRRAGLAAQLRFAVTTQDLRAIILLRRQLASETPRRTPWLRLPSGGGRRHAIWHRDWQSFLRWPSVRVLRVTVLGAVAGVSLLGAWRGTTPLVLVAAGAVLVAAFDAIEPVGQEVDHPTLLGLLPVSPSEVIRRHLAAPAVLMTVVLLVSLAAAIIAGAPGALIPTLVVMVVPTALLSLCCAAISVTNDPFKYVQNPAFGYLQTGVPILLAILGVSVPLLLARASARHGTPGVGAAIAADLVLLSTCWVVRAFLEQRIRTSVPVRG